MTVFPARIGTQECCRRISTAPETCPAQVRHRYGRLEISPCRHFVVARVEERCSRAVCRMSCVTGDPIAFLHCHLLSRSSGRWNRSTASWSAPALTLLSTALGGRLGRLPARTTETLLIYPRFPRFAQLMPAAAPARNGAAEPVLWKIISAVAHSTASNRLICQSPFD